MCVNVNQPMFEEQMDRIRLVTGTQTQQELAVFLDVRQSAVSDAKRRGKIPAEWLLVILSIKNIFPDWILTGMGPCYATPPTDSYATGDDEAAREAGEQALRRCSTQMLANELVRRASIAGHR